MTNPGRHLSSDTTRPDRDLIDWLTDAWQAEMPELDRSQSELTKRAARLGVMLEDQLAAHIAPWGVTRADYSVLSVLRSAGEPYEMKPTELRVRLLLSSGGVSNMIARLERLGLVERQKDPTDARSSWVRLTRKGIKTSAEIVRTWGRAQADIFRAVPAETCKAAADALRDVLLAMGDTEPPASNVRTRS